MLKKELKDYADDIELWVEESKAGDHDAFAKLYDVLVDPLYRYIFYKVSEVDVDDLVETVFLRVWEKLHQYKKRKNYRFASWVFRIAHNLVVDHYRLSKERRVDELQDYVPDSRVDLSPVNSVKSVLNQNLLKSALSNINDSYREFIVYKFVNDFSNKEIAQILKKSEGSLRILQFRALKALKVELKDLGVDYDILL